MLHMPPVCAVRSGPFAHLNVSQLLLPGELLRLRCARAAHMEAGPTGCRTSLGGRLTTTAHADADAHRHPAAAGHQMEAVSDRAAAASTAQAPRLPAVWPHGCSLISGAPLENCCAHATQQTQLQERRVDRNGFDQPIINPLKKAPGTRAHLVR